MLHWHALTLAATQPNGRIDSNPIPALPRVAFMREIEKFFANSIFLPLTKINATQGFCAVCEPGFTHQDKPATQRAMVRRALPPF